MSMLLIALLSAAGAGQQQELGAAPPAAAPLLTDEVIRKAVRETLADDPQPQAGEQTAALRARTVEARMSAAFEQAKVPDCLHDNALKHQPAKLAMFNVTGPYALPWVVAAAVRGKCR